MHARKEEPLQGVQIPMLQGDPRHFAAARAPLLPVGDVQGGIRVKDDRVVVVYV